VRAHATLHHVQYERPDSNDHQPSHEPRVRVGAVLLTVIALWLGITAVGWILAVARRGLVLIVAAVVVIAVVKVLAKVFAKVFVGRKS